MSTKVNASPAAQKLARANQLDLGEVKGSGNGGQVTKPDVEKAIAAKSEAASSEPAAAGETGAGDQAAAVAADAGSPAAAEPPASAAEAAAAAEHPIDAALAQSGQAPPPPAAPGAEVGDKGDVREITKLRDNLGVTWWCPFDDFAMPGEHKKCGRCGATRGGDSVAALGDEVTAA